MCSVLVVPLVKWCIRTVKLTKTQHYKFTYILFLVYFNTLRQWQNIRHFAWDICRGIYLNGNFSVLHKISCIWLTTQACPQNLNCIQLMYLQFTYLPKYGKQRNQSSLCPKKSWWSRKQRFCSNYKRRSGSGWNRYHTLLTILFAQQFTIRTNLRRQLL